MRQERETPPDGSEQSAQRESIWSVSRRWKAIYFPLFTALTIIGAGYVVWHGITHRPPGDIHDAIVSIILRLAPTIIVSAGAGVVVTELGRYAAMLSDILREKTDKWIAKSRKEDREKARAGGLAEGHATGLAEMQKLWLGWNRRRLEHEARGEPFDEPPPSLNGDDGNEDNGHSENGRAV